MASHGNNSIFLGTCRVDIYELQKDFVMVPHRITRRTALQTAGGAAALPLLHIRTAGAAGKLKIAVTTNFTPGADAALRKAVGQWAAQTHTDVQLDILPQYGDPMMLTLAAEAKARTGHDIILLSYSDSAAYAHLLEPMDGVLNRLQQKYGAVEEASEYTHKVGGHWVAVPVCILNSLFPCVGRIDVFRERLGMDLQEVFPAKPEMGPGYDQWTWDAFLAAAETCARAGVPFGLPISACDDAAAWLGMLFRSYGAELVDADGNVAVNSEATRTVLDYLKRLAHHLPAGVHSWDNVSNNQALLSGDSALILNPPSAWVRAIEEQPHVGRQCWHFPAPAGPRGRFTDYSPPGLGVWSFSTNKGGAQELIEWLSEREQVEQICTADRGYEVPPFPSMRDFGVWEREGPPMGTLFNYPIKPSHHATATVATYPAPIGMAAAIYNSWIMPNMVARATQGGQSIEQVIAWTERELEGLKR